MASFQVPGSKAGAAVLRVTRRFMPKLEAELVGGLARVAYTEILGTQRVLTNTLRSSTVVSAGQAQGRNLAYGPGHSPLPISVVDQAVMARKLGEPLVISEVLARSDAVEWKASVGLNDVTTPSKMYRVAFEMRTDSLLLLSSALGSDRCWSMRRLLLNASS